MNPTYWLINPSRGIYHLFDWDEVPPPLTPELIAMGARIVRMEVVL